MFERRKGIVSNLGFAADTREISVFLPTLGNQLGRHRLIFQL